MAIMGVANVAIQAAVVTSTGTNLGVISEVYNASAVSAAGMFGRYFYTPSAGSAGVNIRARVTSGPDGTLRFGGDYTRGYLSVYGPPLA
jgi:hypothetical protein